MTTIKNEDFEILKEIEQYLFDINKDNMKIVDDNFVVNANDVKDMKAFELYIKLYAIIENIIDDKKKMSERSNANNKKDVVYHRIVNNISNNRRNGNIKKLEYWQNELKKYKEKMKKSIKS